MGSKLDMSEFFLKALEEAILRIADRKFMGIMQLRFERIKNFFPLTKKLDEIVRNGKALYWSKKSINEKKLSSNLSISNTGCIENFCCTSHSKVEYIVGDTFSIGYINCAPRSIIEEHVELKRANSDMEKLLVGYRIAQGLAVLISPEYFYKLQDPQLERELKDLIQKYKKVEYDFKKDIWKGKKGFFSKEVIDKGSFPKIYEIAKGYEKENKIFPYASSLEISNFRGYPTIDIIGFYKFSSDLSIKAHYNAGLGVAVSSFTENENTRKKLAESPVTFYYETIFASFPLIKHLIG